MCDCQTKHPNLLILFFVHSTAISGAQTPPFISACITEISQSHSLLSYKPWNISVIVICICVCVYTQSNPSHGGVPHPRAHFPRATYRP